VRRGFCWGDLRKIDHLEDLGVDGRIILQLNLNPYPVNVENMASS